MSHITDHTPDNFQLRPPRLRHSINMDESTSTSSSFQLKKEIVELTQSVAQLETEISQTPEPLRKSSTRVLDLSRFRNFQNLFSTWNNDSDVLKDFNPVTSIHSQHSHHSSLTDSGTAAAKSKDQDDEEEIFRMSDDGDSVVVKSQESVLTTSNDSFSSSERARTKILDVLRCYLYNLRNDMLVMPWDNNGTVATALRDLVDKPDLWEHDFHVVGADGDDDGGESMDLRKLSDEEGVVYELGQYRNTLLVSGDTVADSVMEVAKEILKFGGQWVC